MVEKVKLNGAPKFPYTHDKQSKRINYAKNGGGIVSNKQAALKEALENRIEKEIPERFLKDKALVKSRFVPTETQKRMVWQMAAMAASWQIIRLAIIDPDTGDPISEAVLDHHFREIMKHAREQANFTVALTIYQLAIGNPAEYDANGNMLRPYSAPNLDALKWFDRTRGEAKTVLQQRIAGPTIDGTSVTLVIEGS